MLTNREAFFVTDEGQDWGGELVEFCGPECSREFGHFYWSAVMERTFTELAESDPWDQAIGCDWCGAGVVAVLVAAVIA